MGATLIQGAEEEGEDTEPELCQILPKRSWKWIHLFMRTAIVIVIMTVF
jgi:hypothetical protein